MALAILKPTMLMLWLLDTLQLF